LFFIAKNFFSLLLLEGRRPPEKPAGEALGRTLESPPLFTG